AHRYDGGGAVCERHGRPHSVPHVPEATGVAGATDRTTAAAIPRRWLGPEGVVGAFATPRTRSGQRPPAARRSARPRLMHRSSDRTAATRSGRIRDPSAPL